MTHLAARPLLTMTALCAEPLSRVQVAQLWDSRRDDHAAAERSPNFLENASAGLHYLVMGSGGAARSARIRPPTVDRTSRHCLDISIPRSICFRGRGSRTKRAAHGPGELARGRDHCAAEREFTGYAGTFERIGHFPIANAQHQRSCENINAKHRHSAAVVLILHMCGRNGCSQNSHPKHNCDWGKQNDRGVTPNERSGR